MKAKEMSFGPLVNRNFALLWGGQSISNLGDVVFGAALLLWLGGVLGQQHSWAPLAVSTLLLAEYVPVIFVGPLAGVLVDRRDKRQTMLWMDGLRTGVIAVLVVVIAAPLPDLWKVAMMDAIVLVEATCGQIFNPARLPLIGDIVPGPDQPRASSLSQAVVGLALIVGPAIASFVTFGLGITWAVLANAVSFAVSFAAIFAVRVSTRARPAGTSTSSIKTEFLSGLGVLAHSRVLLAVLGSSVLCSVALGTLHALGVFFVTRNLNEPAAAFGILGAALGVGAVAGSILTGSIANRVGLARLITGSTFGLGISILALSRCTGLFAACCAGAILGAALAGANVAAAPLILRSAPREFVGRITAVITPLASVGAALSVVLAGACASTLSSGFRVRLGEIAFGPVDCFLALVGMIAIAGGAGVARLLHGGQSERPEHAAG